MKVLIAVGGGGHFSPALAVIEQMPKDWEVLLVGRKYTFEGDKALSFEYQTALRLGLLFEPITTGRLQRKLTRHMLPSLIKIPLGLTQATKIVRRYKPNVVLSFGGYVSVPVVTAAALQRIPIVIHEQTLHAGLANKAASRFATKICLSWQQSERFFPKKKTVLTGNPLRKEFLLGGRGKGEGERNETTTSPFTLNALPLIYITGGSGGSHAINVLVEGCVEKLLEKYTVIHQTGDAKTFGDFERLEKIKLRLPEVLQNRYILKKFIDTEQISQILSWADLIISRSGINTITELLYLGKPSLLIPLPYGQRNEQLANAEFVKRIGLAEVVDQLKISPDELFQKVIEMISHLDSYQRHRTEARELIHTDAAEKIIKEVNYAKEKRTA
jgi:UDP-N-acetylglucosamine--N-acetylmuramyl-(pentapeptide) pyrophosphoryl-undecaprenol N-acetylglucosamine transferase